VSFEYNQEPSEDEIAPSMSRYESLGLIANPFYNTVGTIEPGVACEIDAAGNGLLGAIYKTSFEENAKPIWVEKDGELPTSYSLQAMAHAEASLATDDTLNVLYAYVMLFMLKIGVTRATLGALAERISFRDFEETLALYVARVLAGPDESLTSFKVLGPEKLAAFAEEFSADPAGVTRRLFGEPEVERHDELIGATDMRHGSFDDDGEETDDSVEIDDTVGDAPGTAALLDAAAQSADDDSAIIDYLIDYVRAHLSPVLARAIRMYKARGLSALAEEIKITKAPRKTLAATVELAMIRYRRVALIYDELQLWTQIPTDLRSQVVGSITNMRFRLAGNAFMVFLAAPGDAPELEETFGGGERLVWDFHNLAALQSEPETLSSAMVDEWLASATLPDRDPLTMADPVLAQLSEDAEKSLPRFIALAREAIEDAGVRGVAALDEAARAAALEKVAAEQ